MTPLDWAMIRWIRLKSRFGCARRWSGAGERKGIHLDLGFDHIPDRGTPLGGGLVKCQDLQDRFGNERDQPNLLYLVSSALPHDADVQARAAQAWGGAVVLNQNGVGYPGWFGPGWERHNRPMARLHELADVVVYQSEFCRSNAERFLGPRTGSWEVLHNPVDTSVFTPSAELPAEGPVLLLAGTHQFQYRVETALETLALLLPHHPESRLLLAGRHSWADSEAQAVEWIRNKAQELHIADHLDLRGEYTQQEAPNLFRQAHLLLHTKYQDPCPRLVVEAMACGLPVVYSATGGMPELVPESAGAGVPGPEDYEQDHPPRATDLADAVRRVWADYAGFRTGAREHAVSALDTASWLEAHADIFSRLVDPS